MAYRMSRDRFERLVEEVLRKMPKKFTTYFTNITVIVEDYPSDDDARQSGVPKDELLGLFTGVPYPEKGGFFDLPQPLPDSIVLFQRNIEAACSSEQELIREVRTTLLHEVGHYFGMSEGELLQYE